MSKDEPDKLPSEDRSQLETQSNLILDSDGSPITEGSQNQIGHYQIVRKLGEGGMGEVYQAEQLEPVRRKVALKLIKRGMDSKEALSRFELERQSLALMKHANIAQIFDGGVSEQGRLYFVMEYVGGIPINKYCDNGCLNTRQRLELFIQVCEGIQHAHQKGIIHRDIKPSNILVEVQDEKPVPKVIDFGVAKATSAESGDKTASTQIGQIVGTLKYMSPEQVSGVDIDTRTDVYSLGVLLYELLVGVHPVVGRPRLDEKEQPRPMGVEEILRRIREQDPSRPSTQVSTLGESAEQVARERGTDPKTLARELRGDLDWILVKALEKDRARRYGSPSELAADAVRHLRNEPIEARPPSTIYRVGKFVRRHRVGVAAAGVVLVALLAGITGTTIGLIRAVRAEKTASEEAENARQVSNFLVGLFEVSDPSEARGNTITAREILDRGVEKIEGELEDQPTVKAQMMYTMGRVYQSLSLYEQAQPLLEKALEITRNDPGQNRMAVSNSLLQLASLYRQQAKYDEALPLTEEAVAIREEIFGQEHQDVAAALINLGRHLRLTGDYEKARVHLERALAIQEKELGPEHLGVAAALVDLGWLFNLMSEYEKAIEIYERALSIYENKLPEDHPTIASTMHDLGVLHNNIGDHIKARAFLEGALAIKEKVYEPDHPQLAISLDSLGTTLWYMSEYTEAKPYYERALAIREKVHGPKHPDVARSLNNLALLLRYLGAHNKALPLYRRALAIKEETLGPDHPDVALALTNLAYLLSTLTGDINEVSGLLERALAIREKILGPEHPEVADTLLAFAQAYEREGAYDQARLFIGGRWQ